MTVSKDPEEEARDGYVDGAESTRYAHREHVDDPADAPDEEHWFEHDAREVTGASNYRGDRLADEQEKTEELREIYQLYGGDKMTVAIVGSRDYPDEEQVRRFIQGMADSDVVIVSGGARGVDSWAEDQAKKAGLETSIHPALWEETIDHEDALVRRRDSDGEPYNALAGFWRNSIIVEDADFVVGFKHGDSAGTEDTLKKAAQGGIPNLTISEGIEFLPIDLIEYPDPIQRGIAAMLNEDVDVSESGSVNVPKGFKDFVESE